MNARLPPTPPGIVTGEISALISRLHETSQRLEELTAGQIDTVSDAEGRTFVLRRAQEDLRQSEASRQAAILNALPAHVALLDAEGTVVSVNEGWRRFAEENGLQGPPYGIGLNYLTICDRASGDDATSAQQAAETIRAVLAGGGQSTTIEYPCHSPAEKRWFLMTVTSLPGVLGGGAVVMHVDITQRVLGEEALRRNEEEFRAMFELASVGIVQADPLTSRLLRVNKKICKITGYSADEILGMRISELTHPEDREEDSETFQRALLPRSPDYKMEKRFVRKDGSIVWVNVSLTVIRGAAQEAVRIVAAVEDITARKAGEDALRRSEAEFRTLAESMPQMVWITRPDGWNVYFSQQWVDYTGLSLEETLGQGWTKPFHPDDQLRAWDAWRDATTSVGTYSIECRLRRADGVYRWWLIRGVPVKDAAGTVLKWFGTCTDIHDLKMAELEIARSNRVYAVLSGINTLIVRVRHPDELFQEACSIAVDAGGFRMSLIAVADPQTQTIVPMASAGKYEGLLSAVAEILGNPETAPKTMIARAMRDKTAVVSNDCAKDPRLLLSKQYVDSQVRSIAILPLLIADEAVGVLALYSSEAEFFQAQEMKLLTELANDIAFCMGAIRSRDHKDLADQALRASLKEKEALLKEVHHRVKNNMQVITSLLRLESNRIDHPTTKGVLKDMQNRILAMASLHEALYRSNSFAQVDLASYLKELTTQLQRSLVASPGQIAFHLDLLPVGLDLDQAVPCGLIVNELVSNALKHGFPDGRRGTVRVEAAWVSEGLLRLRICDDGIGLSPDFAELRVKSLGLQLVADLARQLGGSLVIGPGPGAVFEVTFRPGRQDDRPPG